MPSKTSSRTGVAALSPRSASMIAVIVFVGGAIGMMLELVGSRLLAPYFGNSLFVWTSLIGVMLGFMSLGYFLGGRLADRRVDLGLLFWILAGAGISIALVGFAEGAFLPRLAESGPVRLLAVISATVLFAVPSTLLGMVSPYCIRLKMHALEDSGATVGSLYALSTLGSITGTFAAGFWLIALFGTHDLVLMLAVGLGVLAVLVPADLRDWRRWLALGVLALILVLGFAGVAEGAPMVDTGYDRYYIRELRDPASGQMLVALSRDMHGGESASYVTSGEPYAFEYYSYYDLAPALGPVDTALMIGGGTFSYPRLFVAAHPEARIDAVEIDDALYDIAKERFGYTDDERIGVYLEDGRTFLNRSTDTYDAVFVDAFKSEQTVPYQLTTRESWQRCADVLADDGVLVMNVIGSPTGPRSEFFGALYATLADVFPQVVVFKVQDLPDDQIQNTMVLACKSESRDLTGEIARVAPGMAARIITDYAPAPGTPVLTDDFAPVDQYLLGF